MLRILLFILSQLLALGAGAGLMIYLRWLMAHDPSLLRRAQEPDLATLMPTQEEPQAMEDVLAQLDDGNAPAVVIEPNAEPNAEKIAEPTAEEERSPNDVNVFKDAQTADNYWDVNPPEESIDSQLDWPQTPQSGEESSPEDVPEPQPAKEQVDDFDYDAIAEVMNRLQKPPVMEEPAQEAVKLDGKPMVEFAVCDLEHLSDEAREYMIALQNVNDLLVSDGGEAAAGAMEIVSDISQDQCVSGTTVLK